MKLKLKLKRLLILELQFLEINKCMIAIMTVKFRLPVP